MFCRRHKKSKKKYFFILYIPEKHLCSWFVLDQQYLFFFFFLHFTEMEPLLQDLLIKGHQNYDRDDDCHLNSVLQILRNLNKMRL